MGNFGNGNLGNECTLQAILHNCRQYLPGAEIAAVCTNPDAVSKMHGIRAVRITDRGGRAKKRIHSGFVKLFRILLFEIPAEIRRWIKTFRTLKGVDMLIMTGTGMITDDDGGSWGMPYEIMKWSVIAKIRRAKVLYVSVGAEPIRNWKTRYFFKLSLHLADYRSFRDLYSKEYLEGIGMNVTSDPVYPDLAYSLPSSEDLYSEGHRRMGNVIGVGLLDYSGQGRSYRRNEIDHLNYIRSVVDIIRWLLENEYAVRILIGDMKYDNPVRLEIKTLVEQIGYRYDSGKIFDESICTVSDLLSQLSETEMIIASRFHNVLLALMLNIPAISLSYNAKNDALMKEYELGEYCQKIDQIDIERLKKQFIDLKYSAADLVPSMGKKTEEFRRQLTIQYGIIFN
jgi:polysaccharide pyruvyl transferase WcaK-like protein